MRKGYFNAYILTCDANQTSYKNGYIVFENDMIIALGDMSDFNETLAKEWRDAQGYLLMPGMVNTHVHIGMMPFRSLADDVPDRLRRFLFPLEQKVVDEALIYHSSKYAIAEMLLSGITTFADMYYFEDSVARASQDMHVRALVGETIIDMKTPDSQNTQESLAYTSQFIDKWCSHDLIAPMIAPHAPNTNTEQTLEHVVRLSQQKRVPVMMHVAEMTYEMSYFKETYQMTPVEFLESKGFFNNHFILVHGIFLSEKDLDIIARYPKVSIAHCIGANTKSAKGIAPLKSILAKNIPVGLGTDGASSANTLELFTQMRLLANCHKTHLQDRAAFPAREIVYLATIGGARALNMQQHIGSLEVGKQADFIVIETDSVNMFPMFDPYSVLVYSANASNVTDVFVAGRQLVKDKQLVEENVLQLRSHLEHHMQKFYQEAEKQANPKV